MTLEESKEVIPMMEAMITQIEEQQNIMAEMLQEIQEKDEKLMCFQEQEERLQQLESELSELLQILPNTEEVLLGYDYHTGNTYKPGNSNLLWRLDKDSFADQYAISLIIGATGICWN